MWSILKKEVNEFNSHISGAALKINVKYLKFHLCKMPIFSKQSVLARSTFCHRTL